MFFRTEGKEAENDAHSVDVIADPTSQLDHSGSLWRNKNNFIMKCFVRLVYSCLSRNYVSQLFQVLLLNPLLTRKTPKLFSQQRFYRPTLQKLLHFAENVSCDRN